jgi:hypothetical protein
MKTALDYYTRCIDLSREHGLGRTEVAHLGQRGFTRLYCGDRHGAKAEVLEAIDVARKAGDRRAEMNASQAMSEIGFDLGEYDLIETHSERGFDLARTLGARAWEPPTLAWRGVVLHAKGHRAEGRELLLEAASITREIGRAFNGARVLGTLAWVLADDDAVRVAALDEGETALAEGCVSHNYFWFYRFAMDSLLSVSDWEGVERYAGLLEDYTRDEPLPSTDFFIARGRALAAFGRGKREAAIVGEVQRLRDEASRAGIGCALPALEEALLSLR